MRCPDDRTDLAATESGVFACRRCRGRAFQGEAFSEIYPGVREVLQLERDLRSGAFARVRTCPSCEQPMNPLRIEKLEAWLDCCESCELLWMEKLDESVVRGLKARWSREYAVSKLQDGERQELAAALATEGAQEQRERRRVQEIVDWLSKLLGS